MYKISYIDLKTGKFKIEFMDRLQYTLFSLNNFGKIEIKEVIKIDKGNY